MIELNIPGRGIIQLEYLVSDINGTIAVDGHLIEGVPRLINELRDRLEVHLLTADTHGENKIKKPLILKKSALKRLSLSDKAQMMLPC